MESLENIYDTIIIGSGPAGLGAAIYALRFNMKVLVIGREFGGLITTTHIVENYPGFPSISGYDLMQQFKAHCASLNAEIVEDEVMDIRFENGIFRLTCDFNEYFGKSIIYATGGKHRKLGVPGEDQYSGRGLSYCATCDGPLFKGKEVAVVGGSDSAAKEALFLSEHASKVYIIYRRQEIHPEPINKRRVEANPKIEIIPNTEITEIRGGDFVTSVVFQDGTQFPVEGVFVEIGEDPMSDLAKRLGVETNENGEILIDKASQTNIPGFFAAGDVTSQIYKQAITGVAEGVTAAYSAYTYINEGKCEESSPACTDYEIDE